MEILTDEKARSTYDKYQQAKRAAQLRNDQLDIKRRKLKQDLEARERNVGVKDDKQFANAGEALSAEIDRLRKEGSRLLEEEQRLMRDHISKGTSIVTESEPSSYRIKLKWKVPKEGTVVGYTVETLKKYLQKYGEIGEILLLKDKKGCALVEFKSKESAEMAIAYETGDLQNPLKISWIGGGGDGKPTSHRPLISQPSTTTAASSTDFESLVLRNLRQAEERKRLIEQMEREDAADN